NGYTIGDKKIIIRSTPQARNSEAFQGRPPCAGNSSCTPICPIQAKYDATIHLKLAQENGVDIRYESIVFKIEKGEGGTISKVLFGNHLKSAVSHRVTRMFRFSYSSEMLPIETNCVVPSSEVDEKTKLPFPKINFKIDDEKKYNEKAFSYAGKVLTKMLKRIG